MTRWVLHDLRDIPAEHYRLESDGRKWLYAARLRQSLASLLATYANSDGTNVYPSRITMAAHLSCSVRTVQRLLNDLETLGVQKRTGRHGGPRGTAVRTLRVPDSKSECHIEESECQIGEVGVPDTNVEVPRIRVPQPPDLDLQPKPPTTTGGGGRSFSPKNRTSKLEQKYMAEIGPFGKWTDSVDMLLANHSYEVVDTAVAAIVKEGFDGVTKSRIGVVLYRLPQYIAKVEESRRAAAQKVNEDAAIEASIARQIEENQKSWQGVERNEETVEDFFGKP